MEVAYVYGRQLANRNERSKTTAMRAIAILVMYTVFFARVGIPWDIFGHADGRHVS